MKEKNRSYVFTNRSIWLAVVLGVFLLVLLSGPKPSAASEEFTLDWSEIPFVSGTSAPQTFEDVAGSGVDVSVVVNVLDENFNILEYYVAAPADNGPFPRTFGDETSDYNVLGVRDIDITATPAARYIRTEITFSHDITIKDLEMGPFYHWVNGGVLKHAALQAFTADNAAMVPLTWNIYGGSTLVVQPHPVNGKDWLRSTFSNDQTADSGAVAIDYGSQPIRKLHWYSWGLNPADGVTFRHVLGSTYLGGFTFTKVGTTAVSLQSFSPATSAIPLTIVVSIMVLGVASLGAVRIRRRK
jgi:hypothetical protein